MTLPDRLPPEPAPHEVDLYLWGRAEPGLATDVLTGLSVVARSDPPAFPVTLRPPDVTGRCEVTYRPTTAEEYAAGTPGPARPGFKVYGKGYFRPAELLREITVRELRVRTYRLDAGLACRLLGLLRCFSDWRLECLLLGGPAADLRAAALRAADDPHAITPAVLLAALPRKHG